MKKFKFILSLPILCICINLAGAQTSGLVLGDILWENLIPNNPGTTVQDKQVRSLKQIPDISGDGINDVIVATGNYWTICYNGINGAEIWRFSTHFGSINTGSVEWEEAVAIADVNNDGIYDAVIGCGGGNEMVYALSGNNGNIIWRYGDSIATSDGDIEAISIRYDFNGDGINDVLVSASGVTNGGRHAVICLNALNGNEIFNRQQPQPFTDDVTATETGGAIGVNNNGAPYSVTGFDTLGFQTWSYSTTGNIWSLKEIPDISNDGRKDILGLAGFTGVVFGISGNTGTQVWTRSLGSSNNGKIAIFDDANGNGYADFVPSAPQIAHRVDSKTGDIIWSNTLGSSYLRGVDNIGDVTGDTIDDVVIATQVPARLLVLNGANGNIVFDYQFGTTLNQRGDRAAVLKDIDTNGVNEFLGGNREGRVICFYGGDSTMTSVITQSTVPETFELKNNYPNPFNPSTAIGFSIESKGYVSMNVFNALGQVVTALVNEELQPGRYETRWNANGFSSGVYFCRMTVTDENSVIFTDTKQLMLLK